MGAQLTRLEKEFVAIMNLRDVQQRIRQLGAEPAASSTPNQFRLFVRAELDKFVKVIKAAGIQAEER